jgi:hypothetical protein
MNIHSFPIAMLPQFLGMTRGGQGEREVKGWDREDFAHALMY